MISDKLVLRRQHHLKWRSFDKLELVLMIICGVLCFGFSLSVTCAVDFTTSTVVMLRTVFEAVATAWRAASLHDRGLVPTISRMMMTPILLSSAGSRRLRDRLRQAV